MLLQPFLLPIFIKNADMKNLFPEWSQGPPKIAIFWNIIVLKNGKVDSLWDWTLPKIRIISKNASNKSCWALNSLQISQWAHMSVSPLSGARGTKDCHLLKYFNVQKWGSRFTLGLHAFKNTHCIQKCFKWRKSHSRGLLIFSYSAKNCLLIPQWSTLLK